MAALPDDRGELRSQLTRGAGGDVLLLSMRRLSHFVAFCQAYEFEDVVTAAAAADRVDADNEPALDYSRRAYKLVRSVTRSSRIAQRIAPKPSVVTLDRDYELFLPIFNHVHEIYSLATVPDWRKRSRTAAVYIVEAWEHTLPRCWFDMLSEFDHIFVGMRHCVDQIAALTGRPCSYLPLGADVLRFAPTSAQAARPIDACNIGRRSAVTHAQLLRLADERKIFYYYDTVAASGTDRKQRTFQVDSPSEHRRLLASILQRSRYYITNRSRVNEPEITLGRDEISARFYEGAAAGAVMLGEAPRTPEFGEQFDWPDAVIHLPFDSPHVGEFLAELDRDEQRLARIRGENVRNGALRHDWIYRLLTIFKTLGLQPTQSMLHRTALLQAIARRAS